MKNNSHHDEIHLKLMRLVQANPSMQQRDIAKALGISLGKANSCINALVKKEFLKIETVRTSENRVSYAYWLTPKGKAPDGHFKFPHLWPVKFPHGGHPDYDESPLMVMRAAASLSR